MVQNNEYGIPTLQAVTWRDMYLYQRDDARQAGIEPMPLSNAKRRRTWMEQIAEPFCRAANRAGPSPREALFAAIEFMDEYFNLHDNHPAWRTPPPRDLAQEKFERDALYVWLRESTIPDDPNKKGQAKGKKGAGRGVRSCWFLLDPESHRVACDR